MQKEAEQRVKEMQSRARLVGINEVPSPTPPPKPFCPPKTPPNTFPENPLFSVFGGQENDKLLIIALLWILWKEKADPKLLLALLYLLL